MNNVEIELDELEINAATACELEREIYILVLWVEVALICALWAVAMGG